MRLGHITRYLTVEDDEDAASEVSNTQRPSVLTNGFVPTPYTNGRAHRSEIGLIQL